MSILDRFSLKGQVALVTGGAGLVGRQVVAALGQAGAQAYIASRSPEVLEGIAGQHCASGLEATALGYDQAEESSILNLKEKILQCSGRIDILINNAVARPMKGGWHDEASAFARSMEINATGLFVMTRAFGDVMAQQGSGSIINVGSIHGMIGPDPAIYRNTSLSGWYPDYFFHKGGMINFTRFVASYYGAYNVRCNCVSPGGFFNDQPAEFVRQYSERTFLGRLAGDSDLMGVVVFLASPASQYITGANIPVDGGYTAK